MSFIRKLLGTTFFSDISLQNQILSDRSDLPLSALGDFTSLFSTPILPSLLSIFAAPHFAPPDWWPVLPFPVENPGDLTAWIGEEGNEPIEPADDPFYFPDASRYTNLNNGDIIDYREVGLSIIWVNVAKAYQISYKSENTMGQAVADLTTLIIPNNPNGKMVSYQMWEDSASLKCAPSYSMVTGISDPTYDLLLLLGYIVNSPDHQGVGSAFVAGIKEGKATLDSIRAVKAFKEHESALEGVDKIVLWGYSGGTIASGHALELQPSYAPDLTGNIVGAALGGFVTNICSVLTNINGGFFAGFGGAGIMGIATEYSHVNDIINTHVRSGIRWRYEQIGKTCIGDNLINFIFHDFWSYTDVPDGSLMYDEGLQDIFDKENLGVHNTPDTNIPLMVYQGVQDQIVDVNQVDQTVDYYVKNGMLVDYYRLSATEHVSTMILAEVDVLKWIAKVFNEDYKPSSCGSWQEATRTTEVSGTRGDSNWQALCEGNWEEAGVLAELQ